MREYYSVMAIFRKEELVMNHIMVNHTGHAKSSRVTAGLAALVMLVILLLSNFYIAAESGHECSGHHCPVCACILQCRQALRQIGSGVVSLFEPCFFFFLVFLTAGNHILCLFKETLVSRKIRLNN